MSSSFGVPGCRLPNCRQRVAILTAAKESQHPLVEFVAEHHALGRRAGARAAPLGQWSTVTSAVQSGRSGASVLTLSLPKTGRRPQLVGELRDLRSHHQSLQPGCGETGLAIVGAGDLPTHRRCRVGIIPKVSCHEDGFLKGGRSIETPQSGFKALYDVPTSLDICIGLSPVMSAIDRNDLLSPFKLVAVAEQYLVLRAALQRAADDTGEQTTSIYAFSRTVGGSRTPRGVPLRGFRLREVEHRIGASRMMQPFPAEYGFVDPE